MPHASNFTGKVGYKTASPLSSVDHAQMNFPNGLKGMTKKHGQKTHQQKNFVGNFGVPGKKGPKSHFGEKAGTGQRGGY
jgi:hypothetical protein